MLVDPVLHGWTKTLRIINYLLALPKQLKHRLHIIPDKNCIICEGGDNPWNPTESEKEVEKSLFRYETRVIKECLKTEQILKYEETEGILFYQGMVNSENQLRTQDLDGCKFFDFMEIGQPVPVVLEDSPVLYSYIMWIHNKIYPYARVKATVRDVCKKMRVPTGLRKLVKRIILDCVKYKIKTKKVM